MAASLKPSDPTSSSRRPSNLARRGPTGGDTHMVPIAEDDNETRTKGEELHSERDFEEEEDEEEVFQRSPDRVDLNTVVERAS